MVRGSISTDVSNDIVAVESAILSMAGNTASSDSDVRFLEEFYYALRPAA